MTKSATVLYISLPRVTLVERDNSAVYRMPDSQASEPGFESSLLPFLRLGFFVLSIDTPVDSAV